MRIRVSSTVLAIFILLISVVVGTRPAEGIPVQRDSDGYEPTPVGDAGDIPLVKPVHPGHDVGGGDPGTNLGGQFPSHNIELLGHLPLSTFGPGGRAGADCWGYVSPSGREYALFCFSDGFSFVEVTDPVQPVVVKTFLGPDTSWRDIKVFGTHAYGVSETSTGIEVFDMSDIDNGNVTRVGAVLTGGTSATHNVAINEDSGYLYRLGGGNTSDRGLRIYDLNANPASPTLVAQFNSFYVHDAQIVSYTSGPFAGREIAFCCGGPNIGFTDTRVRIVDVTNKNSIFQVSSASYAGRSYCHQGWLSEDKQYFYMNDELDEDSGTAATTTTRIFDVSDINSPVHVNSFTTGLPSIDHNLYVHEGLIYESNYTTGLRVFDAADPLNPVEVAWLDTFPSSDAPSFNGTWSNYPYLPSGNIIVSDIQQGLIVARLVIDRIELDLSQGLGQGPPATFDPDGCTRVNLAVTEVGLEHDPATLRLFVEDIDGVTEHLPESLPKFGAYEVWLDAIACGQTVRFWAECETPEGVKFRSPSRAPVEAFSAFISQAGAPVFADDGETDQGWTTSGTATEGLWERGVPVNNGLEDPSADFDGSGSCFLTGNDAADIGLGLGTAIIDSGPITFSQLGGSFSYAFWFNGTRPASGDFLHVSVKLGSAPFQIVRSYNAFDTQWHSEEIRFGVGEEFAGASQIRIKFEALNASFSDNRLEVGIDAVVVNAIDCSADCFADLDGNGTTDVFDFTLFASAFGSQVTRCTSADFDADGAISVFDFGIFATEFGCSE